jgi:hypothetical protein
MRDFSATTVSGTSPRQIGSGCLRTAGVRSTGMSASAFLAVRPGFVASVECVASVASGCVASGEYRGQSRSAPEVSRRPGAVLSSVVASLRRWRLSEEVQSVASASVPVALRSHGSAGSASVRGVSSPVALRRSSGVSGSGCVDSPRQVLRRAFERLAETSRDGVFRRLSRRFGRVDRVASRSVSDSRVVASAVASRSVVSGSVEPICPSRVASSPAWLRSVASPVCPRHLH